jgi:phosphoglycolate phosphatase-like HAD superfamily hydrolase
MELSRRHQDFVLALLTGNTEAGARIKLQSYGLDSYFPLGAYGSDHHDRNALGPIAIDRAEKAMGRPYPATKALVIGDTEKDIACAHACGAKVVAVATGAAPLERLEAQAPDGILDDLSDVPRAIALFEELLEL